MRCQLPGSSILFFFSALNGEPGTCESLQVFRDLARGRECEILEGHLLVDHVHLLISIHPKYLVAQAVGYIKGKSAIHVARNYMGQRRNFTGHQFWATGYNVSTVGRDEKTVRAYIKAQEEEDRRLDQLDLFK